MSFFVRVSHALVVLSLAFSFNTAFAGKENGRPFPTSPHTDVTPGELCQHPDTYRYPERIAYCERDVTTEEKREIIREYDARFGYRIGRMNRQDFKIDHYIPLCAGGSNSKENLWPQHKSVYELTDPLEQSICERMAAGELKQVEAIAIIKEAKANPSKIESLWFQLESFTAEAR